MVLLAALRGSRSDLARLVESVSRDDRRLVIVSTRAVKAWEEREPQAWATVKDWLAARGVAVVEV
ncbi:MAG TPA: hypothetical protein VFN71_09495 [Methylomirabilota bacterium]|nr:hypothetical protein [Methylomirabilota bacterium]